MRWILLLSASVLVSCGSDSTETNPRKTTYIAAGDNVGRSQPPPKSFGDSLHTYTGSNTNEGPTKEGMEVYEYLNAKAEAEFAQAEESLRDALRRDEEAGNEAGMAHNYEELGRLYQEKRSWLLAEGMFKKALAVHEKIGNEAGVAATYDNLWRTYSARGDVELAKEMQLKSMAANERLGRAELLAILYAQLGLAAAEREDSKSARELLTQSRELFAKIEMKNKEQMVQGWIDSLPENPEKAAEHLEQGE